MIAKEREESGREEDARKSLRECLVLMKAAKREGVDASERALIVVRIVALASRLLPPGELVDLLAILGVECGDIIDRARATWGTNEPEARLHVHGAIELFQEGATDVKPWVKIKLGDGREVRQHTRRVWLKVEDWVRERYEVTKREEGADRDDPNHA